MALMFQRLAHNYAKAGYYPTDGETTKRILNALSPCETGVMRILDPCCGEGVALAEVKHVLGERCMGYGIEYDEDRAWHAKDLLDHCIHSDIHDCVIGARSFGFLLLNPPYGETIADRMGLKSKTDRLEKQFYRMTNGLLQYGGVMALIVPRYSLDKELSIMIARHFHTVKVYAAPEQQFKQVVVLGIKQRSGHTDYDVRDVLMRTGKGDLMPDIFPEHLPNGCYQVPTALSEPKFYKVRIDHRQLESVIVQSKTLWDQMGLIFHYEEALHRRPAKRLSQWHLALALAAGQVSGCVRSDDGRLFVIKGDTFKDKKVSVDHDIDCDGGVSSTRSIHTDRFVPTIRAWDFTPNSPTHGRCFTIK